MDTVNQVTIVGAGPAGLMLACTLLRYGIQVTILDDRPSSTATGRADGLQPKTIETLKQLGLADALLEKGVKVYDICFWKSTATEELHRTAREIHYPTDVVDLLDPHLLLIHQGMIEDVFIQDLKARGVEVQRNSSFLRFVKPTSENEDIHVEYQDLQSGKTKVLKTKYLVGCDGAHSNVRKCIDGAEMEGDQSGSVWGILDAVIETEFPDLWSKTVVHSEKGAILAIPRERNMTRLYIELQDTAEKDSKEVVQDFVMKRAEEIFSPYKLTWKRIEWFAVYRFGQRAAKRFSDDTQRVFIVGDAAHNHSPKAAQGMNVSMHDSFNLSWKLALTIKSLALPSLLKTYTEERKDVAQDLLAFDFEHANAYSAGDPEALAENFAQNVRFISGLAEYGVLARISAAAHAFTPLETEMDDYIQPNRYIGVSKVFTYALVTKMNKERFEIADLPMSLQESRWTIYVDDICKDGKSCTSKWVGDVEDDEMVVLNVRPDGYVGSLKKFHGISNESEDVGDEVVNWLQEYYGGFLKS
ncbi:hypothetical protein SS1G_08429 [Sclerotinia sclerotiorum 1980 UF-70]|uniref:Uncharacterized protein n=1 Tax=Sclerotinia sclerotiorum (strain ATCC 18683 / 1980 / Ss-1) TaxID=665079 RepID=A7ESX4_SCLS1|nr:hypothetical protein SS1G_08429 [Sclerotinia sclerotiorum 1980 UF-70]EDN92566.1 hypothetical protein SS1G_08429 [Sclerotinia sclerotiorum 1980 UF-70]